MRRYALFLILLILIGAAMVQPNNITAQSPTGTPTASTFATNTPGFEATPTLFGAEQGPQLTETAAFDLMLTATALAEFTPEALIVEGTAEVGLPELTAEPGFEATVDPLLTPCTAFAPEAYLDDAPYLLGQGNVAFEQGNYARAIAAYTCSIAQNPSYAPAYVSRGFAYAAQVDYERALADYNRALALDEALVSAYTNRGVLYVAQGNFGLALTDFDLALALDPNNAAAYNNRAVVEAAEGNYDFAIADLQTAISLDPDYAAPHATLGAVYSAMASASYAEFRRIAGPARRLPSGAPDDVLVAIADSQETGNFGIWLPLLVSAGT